MGTKSAENLLNGLKDSLEVPFERVLFALGIRHVGETVAKKIAKSVKNIDNLLLSTYDELIAIDEVGDKIALSIIGHFRDETNVRIVDKLRNKGLRFEIEEVAQDSNKLDGKSFVVSGVFTLFSRDELKKLIESNGGKNVGSISAKTDFVIAGENMGPAKLEKANKLNIPILSENEFNEMIS
jgi:DNA ligase (NAD+)